MRSFLIVEKGEHLLTIALKDELLQIKKLVDELDVTVQSRNDYIKRLEAENRQIKGLNEKLLKNANPAFRDRKPLGNILSATK